MSENREAKYQKDYEEFKKNLQSPKRITFVGLTNTGKSTLFNKIFGENIAGVSAKAGYTKDAQSNEKYGFIFTDTPGLQGSGETEEEILIKYVYNSDLIILVINASVGITDFDANLYIQIEKQKIPCIIVINKIDQVDGGELQWIEQSVKKRLNIEEIILVSAKKEINIDLLIKTIYKKLPEKSRSWFVVKQTLFELKEEEAKKQILWSAGGAAALALIPVPVVDLFLITPIEVYLILKIANIYGYEFSYKRALELATAISGTYALRKIGRQFIKLVPAYGPLISAGIAFGGVYGLGEAVVHYFENGMKFTDKIISIYKEKKEEWQKKYITKIYKKTEP